MITLRIFVLLSGLLSMQWTAEAATPSRALSPYEHPVLWWMTAGLKVLSPCVFLCSLLFKNHPEILPLKLKSVSFLSSGVWQIVGFEDNESTGIVGISGSIDWPHWLMFGSKNPDISATSPLISFLYLSLYWSATQSQWSLTLICLFCSLTLLKLSLHPPLDVSSQR